MTGDFCIRHSLAVIGVWVLLLVGAAFLVPRFLTNLTGPSLTIPGSQSDQAQQAILRDFASAPSEQAVIVFSSGSLTVDAAVFRGVVGDTLDRAAHVPFVVRVRSPYVPLPVPTISADRRTAIAIVDLRGSEQDRQRISSSLQTAAAASARPDLSIYYTGGSALTKAITDRQAIDIVKAEAVGLPIAIIILLIAFRTVVSALIPGALGFVGIGIVFGILGAFDTVVPFDVLVESIVTMIGLAIGIDYSLLLITRYRSVRHQMPSKDKAISYTMQTAGRAAFFSGVTVLVSLVGLFAVRGIVFRNVAIAVLVTVAVMLLVTLTLLPAVLHRLGDRIDAGRLPLSRRDPDEGSLRWRRWAGWVTRHAVPVSLLIVALFLGLASPLLRLNLGFDSGVNSLGSSPAAEGYNLIGRAFSPGYASSIPVVIHGDAPVTSASNLAALDRLTRQLQTDHRVAGITSLRPALRQLGLPATVHYDDGVLPTPLREALSPILNADRGATSTITTITLRSAPDSPAAVSLVRALRTDIIPRALVGTSLTAQVGGLTAQIADLDTEVSDRTPVVFVIILGLSFLLLAVAFRSLLLPLKAIMMNLLVVGAAGGLLVLGFQDGRLSNLLQFPHIGSIQIYLPLLAFAILYGLSMDYEVFMVSRMREFWDAGHDNSEAVAYGLADVGRIVTAASSIMFIVFASAIATTVLQLKEIGFALAVAILLDATVIRLMLVPALMRLLGRWNWWSPFGQGRPDARDRSPAAHGHP